MNRSRQEPRRLMLVAAVILAAGCSAGGGAIAGSRETAPSRAATARAAGGRSFSRVAAISRDPAGLVHQLSRAEAVLASTNPPPAAEARQSLIVQLTCLRIAAHPGWAAVVIRRVAPALRAAATADIAATADLVMLTAPAARLPHWRIIPAAALAALRADYRTAQAATGVGWSYLAAINFVESDFGRVAGPSSAGAQGPMQFMPATWAAYGHGDIHRARDAILAAARFLADHGAPADIGQALYAYNPSLKYVDAVLRYARRLRADPRALIGYYNRQVIFRLASGWVLLPLGYGIERSARPIALRL